MDNQEAIKELSEWLDGCCGGEEIEPTRQALRLAISALQAQEAKTQLSAKGTTFDLISRQDAIDIVTGYSGQLNGYIGTPNDTDVYAYARGLILGIERNLNALPSAHPVAKDINVPCKDTISRTEAMNAVSNWLYDTQTTETSDEVLLKLPSAQPETKAQLPGEGTTFDLISRQAAIDALMEFDKKLRKINWYQYPHTEYECRGVDEAIVKIENVPSAQPKLCDDAVSREAAIDVAENAFVRGLLASPDILRLPSVQPEPISEAYAKAVFTWLFDYQIKAAELKGRYTPYEVLSWVVNDWRKEHEGSD